MTPWLRGLTASVEIDNRQSTIDNGRAFSLIELMIAIVILGLGLVMVATMFPVAWTRARDLAEISTEQSVVADAEGIFKTLVRPATVAPWLPSDPPYVWQDRLVAGGLLGDLFYDPNRCEAPPNRCYPMAYGDTRVHALHMSNALAALPNQPLDPDGDGIISEDPWAQERLQRYFNTADYESDFTQTLGLSSPFDPQIQFWQRIYPPMDAVPQPNAPNYARWWETLGQRRFSWAVLYRFRDRVGPETFTVMPTPQQMAQVAEAMGLTRNLDVYFVTLRRPNPTNRYALQLTAPDDLPAPVDATNLFNTSAAPVKAQPSGNDVAFPVAWRVEVEFIPNQPAAPYFANREPPSTAPTNGPTGVATEIQVPRSGTSVASGDMLVGMFPEGTRFIDELSGQVYRAVKRRVNIGNSGEQTAILTLDREVFVEDVDYCDPLNSLGKNGIVEPQEFVRTVWVFPPPVDRENSAPNSTTPTFSGSTPVINIDVRPVSLSPTM